MREREGESDGCITSSPSSSDSSSLYTGFISRRRGLKEKGGGGGGVSICVNVRACVCVCVCTCMRACVCIHVLHLGFGTGWDATCRISQLVLL